MNDDIIKILFEYEKMVLVGMIKFSDKRYSWLNDLSMDYFLTIEHKHIFNVIDENKELEESSLLINLNNDSRQKGYDIDEFLDYLDMEGCFCDDNHPMEELRRYKKFRNLTSVYDKINPLNPKQEDIDKLFETIEHDREQNISSMNQEACFMSIHADIANKNHTQAKLTGFESYDSLTGGLTEGVHIIAGRPGAGKTTFGAIKIPLVYGETHKDELVLVFSLEVALKAMAQKAVANMTNITIDTLKSGKFGKYDGENWRDATSNIGDNVHFIEVNSINALEMNQIKKSYEKKHGKKVGLMVLDYLQIMNPNNPKYGNEVERLQNISGDLRTLSKELPLIILAQLNRDGDENECPQAKNLKGCSQLEQDACTIFMLWRKNKEQKNFISGGLVKNRFGEAFVYDEYTLKGDVSDFETRLVTVDDMRANTNATF